MERELRDIIIKTIGYTEDQCDKCKDCKYHEYRDSPDYLWSSYCTYSNLGDMPVSSTGRCDRYEEEDHDAV